MAGLANYEVRENVAVIQFDDGKVNAMSYALLDAIEENYDRALADDQVKSVLLIGRPGIFSAGFDLKEMKKGHEAATKLVARGGRLALRFFTSKLPLVMAVSGHAMAMGAIFLMTADKRVGVKGDFKIGLNESAIGMVMPPFGCYVTEHRLDKKFLTRSVINGEIFTPELAMEAGFLDSAVEPDALFEAAVAEAQTLAALDTKAVYGTKMFIRGETLKKIQQHEM